MGKEIAWDPEHLAELWVRRQDGDCTVDEQVLQSVTLMGFVAPAEIQWSFIVSAAERALTDDALGHLAAGPFECLLGHHGEAFIERVEAQAHKSPRFHRMTTGAWQYMMTGEIWARVQALQAEAEAQGNSL